MRLYDELTLEDISFTNTNKKVSYAELYVSFDIETTSTTYSGGKVAFMYVWSISINSVAYYGRTWEQFIETLTNISNFYSLGENRRIIIYSHNLSYEFQFIRKLLSWVDVFSLAERKPLKALCDLGFEFRCSYVLSGQSLERLAKGLENNIEKLVGDLDYSLIRHNETPLSVAELGYVENDVIIVTEYIKEQAEHYGGITKIPLTNTGRVRAKVRHNCYYTNTNHRKSSRGKYERYRNIMNDLTLNGEVYSMMKRAFMGGFTHANAEYVGKVLNDVTSLDFTSSYPATMLSEQFPMSEFKPIKVKNIGHFEALSNTYCLIFDARFKNIAPKITQENYISESKCFELKGATINNGRVSSAEYLATTITNVDYDIMKQAYNWESLELANVYFAYKSYLPKAIIESVIELFRDKTLLAGEVDKIMEYNLSKAMLNSTYGMCVTDIVKDKHTYINGWGVEVVDLNEEIEKYNKSRNRFLYYPWGVWITAYSRRNLWTGIIATGGDYVYSDTDSIKLVNYENNKAYVKWYNNQIKEKLKAMCEHHRISYDLLEPKKPNGERELLGAWDYEGTYPKFKTLGAKRYLQLENGKLEITVAGLSKQDGLKYMLEQCGGCVDSVFNMFNDELFVPAERTGKMTHTYLDGEIHVAISDYLGNELDIIAPSGVHLEPCEFTLSLAYEFKQFLRNLSKGYLYTGDIEI